MDANKERENYASCCDFYSLFENHKIYMCALMVQHKGQKIRANYVGSVIQISALLHLISMASCKLNSLG